MRNILFLLLSLFLFTIHVEAIDYKNYSASLSSIVNDHNQSVYKSNHLETVSILIPDEVLKYNNRLYKNKTLKHPFIKYNNIYYAPFIDEFYNGTDVFSDAIYLDRLHQIIPSIQSDTITVTMDHASIIDKPLIVNQIESLSTPLLIYNKQLYIPLSTRFIASKHIPVLMYHSISEDDSKWNSICVSPNKFKQDLLALKESGYTTISPEELVFYMEGKIQLPENPVMITFDDGYLDNYTYAYPILKELGMKATISIVVKTVGETPGDKPHFNWSQAKEMEESGYISIQPHSFDLHYLANQKQGKGQGLSKLKGESLDSYKERIMNDSVMAISKISEKLNKEVLLYAYPYGIYNDTTESILKELGIKITLTTMESVSPLSNNSMLLSRINASNDLSSLGIIKKIQEYTTN